METLLTKQKKGYTLNKYYDFTHLKQKSNTVSSTLKILQYLPLKSFVIFKILAIYKGLTSCLFVSKLKLKAHNSKSFSGFAYYGFSPRLGA